MRRVQTWLFLVLLLSTGFPAHAQGERKYPFGKICSWALRTLKIKRPSAAPSLTVEMLPEERDQVQAEGPTDDGSTQTPVPAPAPVADQARAQAPVLARDEGPTEAEPPPPVPRQPQPQPQLQIQSVSVRLSALARRQVDEQNLSLVEIANAVEGEAQRKGRDLFEIHTPLRGGDANSSDLGLRRRIEFWRPRRGVVVVRHVTNPFRVYPRAQTDLQKLNINYLKLEEIFASAKTPPTILQDDSLFELEIPRAHQTVLRVTYQLLDGEAHLYRAMEFQSTPPPRDTKPRRIPEPPVNVDGVLLTPQAQRQLEMNPFEIDSALNEIPVESLRTASAETHEYSYLARSGRAFTIGFVDDDLYGIVVTHIVERVAPRPPAPDIPLPFVVTPVTERALNYWDMTLDDLSALFRNRKQTPVPIGENAFGYDPMREMFNSFTSRSIPKASGGRNFQVITSSTQNGQKPIVLSIRELIEGRSVVKSVVRPKEDGEMLSTPTQPFFELNEVVGKLLQSEQRFDGGVLHTEKPELYAALIALQETSREYQINLSLLSDADLRSLIEEENKILEQKMSQQVNEIARHVFSGQRQAMSEAVIEIRADDRTQWSRDFALNLKSAFELYARRQTWSVQSLSGSDSSSHVLAMRGQGVQHFMKLEEGMQRSVGRTQESVRRSGRERPHTARVAVTVIEGPLTPESVSLPSLRRLFDGQRRSQSTQFVRSYHMPSNKISDERVESGAAISPEDLLEKGDLSVVHRQIEYSLLVNTIKRLLGESAGK